MSELKAKFVKVNRIIGDLVELADNFITSPDERSRLMETIAGLDSAMNDLESVIYRLVDSTEDEK